MMMAFIHRRVSRFDVIMASLVITVLIIGVAYTRCENVLTRRRQDTAETQRQWELNQPSPFEYVNLPWPVIGGPFHPGDIVPVEGTRCNYSDAPITYQFTRRIINADDPSIVITLLQGGTTTDPGCITSVTRATSLPETFSKTFPPGRYFINGVVTIEGPYRRFQLPWKSATFEVTAP